MRIGTVVQQRFKNEGLPPGLACSINAINPYSKHRRDTQFKQRIGYV